MSAALRHKVEELRDVINGHVEGVGLKRFNTIVSEEVVFVGLYAAVWTVQLQRR